MVVISRHFEVSYSRPEHRKVKAAKLQRAKNGLLTASEAPYGYKKASGRLEIDPEAAQIVQLIYELAAKGYGAVNIAKILKDQKVPRSEIYKRSTGQMKALENNENDNSKTNFSWCYQTVGDILCNRIYLGELRTHKTEVTNHKIKQRRNVPLEEQFITLDAHPAIICEEQFREVQSIRQMHLCPAKIQHAHMFRGLLFCDACGHPLSVAHRKLKEREEDLYRCVYHYYHPQVCTQTHAIFHAQLYAYVLKQIRALAKSMKCRKVDAPIVQYVDAADLNESMLHEVIERIEVGHMGRRTQISSAVKIVWKW